MSLLDFCSACVSGPSFLKMQRRTLDLNERIFVIKNYYARTSYKHVEERWEANFRTPVPSKSTMFNLVSKFEVTGSVLNSPKEGHPRTVCSPENKDIVAAAFLHSPKQSIRQASKELNISQTSLHRILHDIDLKPYRPHLLHALNENDPDKRLEFCTILWRITRFSRLHLMEWWSLLQTEWAC